MNNNGFTPVGIRGKPAKNVHSQVLFFNALTKSMLNELLHRFKSQYIAHDIIAKRQNIPQLSQNIIITSNVISENNPSIYLNYELNNKKVFHFSIHLAPNKFNSRTNGLIHVVQNNTRNRNNTQRRQYNNRRRTVKFRYHPQHANSIIFNLGVPKGQNMNTQYIDEANIVLQVLNEYFDKNNPKYLGTLITSNNKFPKLNTIYSQFKNYQNAYMQ